jgi:O-antigen/teichoic acid export membrane protein
MNSQILAKWAAKGVLTLLDQALISGSSAFASILLARVFTLSAYGAYAVAISLFLFLSSVHNALLLEPLGIFGSTSYRSNLRIYFFAGLRINCGLCVGISVLLSIALVPYRLITGNVMLSSTLWAMCAAYMLPTLTFWLCRRLAYLQLKPHMAVRGSATYALFVVTVLYGCSGAHWLSPAAALIIQGAGALVASLVLVWGALPPCPIGATQALPVCVVLNEHWRYGKWVLATSVGYWLTTAAYYLFIGVFLPLERVAELKVLQNLSMPINQFMSAQTNLLLPLASSRFADYGAAALRQSTRSFTIWFGLVGVSYLGLLTLFGPDLMRLLYPASYASVARLLPLSAVPTVFIAAAQGTVIAFWARRLSQEVFWGYSISGITSLLVGLLLTRYYGLTGSLIGLTIASAVFLIVVLYRNHIIQKQDIPLFFPEKKKAAVPSPTF